MILVLGEILFDVFPADKRIGGAPFNFAFHLSHLGFSVRFVSRVGHDALGRELLDFLGTHGFAAGDVQQDNAYPTGTVTVSMDPDGSHTFSIVPDTAYDHIEFNTHVKELCKSGPDLVYFGILIQRTPAGRKLIQNVLAAVPSSTVKFCDINLRPDCYTRPVLDDAVAASDMLKLNHEELDLLVPGDGRSLPDRAAGLIRNPGEPHGPGTVILTRGEKGSIWAVGQGEPEQAPGTAAGINIIDTVGAGDAYSAMAAAGRLSGLPDRETMGLAQRFAAGICGIRGALPQDLSFYTEFKSRLGHGR